MLLWNYVFLPPLEPLLALPHPPPPPPPPPHLPPPSSLSSSSSTGNSSSLSLCRPPCASLLSSCISKEKGLEGRYSSGSPIGYYRSQRGQHSCSPPPLPPQSAPPPPSSLHCHEHYAATLHVPLTFFVLHLGTPSGSHAFVDSGWE